MFNDYGKQYSEDHSISGWSKEGLVARKEKYLNVLPALHVSRNSMILDLGCGSGFYSRILRSRGYRVLSADFAFSALKEARSRDSASDSDYVCADVYSLPFKDSTFDHLVCIGVFQSLSRPLMALNEIHRVLKKKGTLVVITLNKFEIVSLVRSLLPHKDYLLTNGRRIPRLSTYNPLSFKQLVISREFEIVSLEPVHVFPERLRMLKKLAAFLNMFQPLSFSIAVSFMIAARKH